MKTGTRMLAVAVAAGALFALTAGAATAETPTPSTKTVPINLGFMPNMQGGAPIAIGEDQGYFAQEGLSLNKSSFTAGPVELTAMIAGSLDIGYIGPGAMPSLFKGGSRPADHRSPHRHRVPARLQSLRREHAVRAKGQAGTVRRRHHR